MKIFLLKNDQEVLDQKSFLRVEEKLAEYGMQIVIIEYPYEETKIKSFANDVNEIISNKIENSSSIAITNILPDLPDKVLKEVSKIHVNHENDYLYFSEYENKTLLQDTWFWMSFNSNHWDSVGGFNKFLSFPNNLYQDLKERCDWKGLKRNHYDMRFISVKFYELKNNLPWKLVKFDQKNLPYCMTCQNFIKPKNPEFLVIGAQKSSSSTIIESLAIHPEINVPKIKRSYYITDEVHFFDSNLYNEVGLEWYQTLFYHKNKNIAGEKTPEYISDKEALTRIKKHIPKCKLILCLRNPVNRAWSALQHIRRDNTHWGLQVVKEGLAEDALDLVSREHLNSGIIRKGIYSTQVEQLFNLFPKEQLLILIHERIQDNHEDTFKNIFEFLGVDSSFKVPSLHKNRGSYEDKRHNTTLKRLYDFYESHNEKLFELLGYEIQEWKFENNLSSKC